VSIPAIYRDRFVYHITHINNLPGILNRGLLAHSEMENLGAFYQDIAYSGIQTRRSAMAVTCGPGGVVHDYVPLYFCKRSPMLYAIVHNKIVDERLIIYLQFPILIMNQYPFVFTDASANTRESPNFYDDPADLDKIDWGAIETWKWGKQHDIPGQRPIKQAKMAELLIHKRVDPSSITKIVVWNKSIAAFVRKLYEDEGLSPPRIQFGNDDYYYIDDLRPPVTGPYFIKKTYQETVETVTNNIGGAHSPKFRTLSGLRDTLREGLDCLPETAEIIDLETDNTVHNEDVGTHTLMVVDALRELPEYERMNETDRLLVEVAAFLHDIGKGPRIRWEAHDGRQQVDPDHPINALPMVQRILTEDVARMRERSAKVICKLVCYHDLVGDIIHKGRRIEELVDVVENERELDMLIALAKADMLAINRWWVDDERIQELRRQVIEEL
jgi:HD superfamily phosphodiesterase